MAVALIGGWASIPMLTVIGIANGCLGALAGPSSSAMTRQTVPPADLATAVAGRRLCQNFAQVVGFAVAGVLVAAFGSGWAIAIDAATYAVAAVCFGLIRVAALPAPETRTSMLGDLGAGAAEVFRHTWLWLLIGQALLYHLFFGGVLGVLGPIVVGDELRPGGLGLGARRPDGGLHRRRAGLPAVAAAARPVRRHRAAVADRGVPVRDGALGPAVAAPARRVPARLRPRAVQRELGPVDPAERRGGQAGAGLLLRPGRLVRGPAAGTRAHRAGRRGGRLRPVAGGRRDRDGGLVAARSAVAQRAAPGAPP